MTGTGTQTDPYIVGNEEEFREAVNQFGAHVECTEGMIFDYENRQEDVPIFTVRAREVRCNGLTVKYGRFDCGTSMLLPSLISTWTQQPYQER